MSKDKALKPSDVKIAERYIATGNGVQSVLDVFPDKSYGAAKKYYYRLSLKEEYKSIIKEAKALSREHLQVTHQDITRDLIEIKERCMQATPVTDRKGNPTGTWNFNATAALKAIENLAKHIGFYEGVDQKHIKVGVERLFSEGDT